MTLCKTMALPDAQLAMQAPQVLDLDEVLRCTALVNLWGIADTYYTGGTVTTTSGFSRPTTGPASTSCRGISIS